MDDKEIIALFLARDEGAIQAAQRQYGGYCAAIANGILDDRGAAEECVNDTWLKCWQSIPPQHPRSLKGFAGRIARNLALSVRRADMAQKRGGGQTALALDELSEVVSGGETPEGAMDRQALRADVPQAQHRRAVGDHRRRVPPARQLVALVDILFDLQAGLGHPRRVGQGQGLPVLHLHFGHGVQLAPPLIMQPQGFRSIIHGVVLPSISPRIPARSGARW